MGFMIDDRRSSREVRNSTMTGGLIAILMFVALPALAVGILTNSKKTIEEGKTYRFFWKAKPALGVFAMEAVTAALRSSGAQSITMNQGPDETTGSHIMKATTTKEIDIGKPTVLVTGIELTFTGVTEVPA